jgi:hypothetical protein
MAVVIDKPRILYRHRTLRVISSLLLLLIFWVAAAFCFPYSVYFADVASGCRNQSCTILSSETAALNGGFSLAQPTRFSVTALCDDFTTYTAYDSVTMSLTSGWNLITRPSRSELISIATMNRATLCTSNTDDGKYALGPVKGCAQAQNLAALSLWSTVTLALVGASAAARIATGSWLLCVSFGRSRFKAAPRAAPVASVRSQPPRPALRTAPPRPGRM